MTQSSLQDAPTTAFVSSEIPLNVKEAARYLRIAGADAGAVDHKRTPEAMRQMQKPQVGRSN